jgi:serine phosphatase RsbU (regulator of sigma subunit)
VRRGKRSDEVAQFKNEWLADLIEQHRDRILDEWVDFVRAEGGPHFETWPDEDMRRIFSATLDRVISALRIADVPAMGAYIREIVAQRVEEGFQPQEIQQSIWGLRGAVLKLVEQTAPDVSAKYQALLSIHSLYSLGSLELGRVFHEFQSAQQTRLTALYELSTVLSRSLDQETVLNTAVRKVAEAMGATSSAIVLTAEDGDLIEVACSYQVSPELLGLLPQICRVLGCAVDRALELGEKEAAHIVPDVRDDESLSQWRDLLVSQRCLAIACAPLVAKEHALGGLIILLPEPRDVPESETDFLVALAGHTATAMQNARLFEEAKGKRELSLLLAAGKLFTSTLDLDELLSEVARLAADSVGADLAGVLMPDERQERMQAAVYYAGDARMEEVARRLISTYANESFPIEHDIPSAVFSTGEPLLIRDYSALPEGSADLVALIGSAILAPMKVRDRIIGIFAVASANTEAFDEDDLSLIVGVADQAAIAIENAKLYEHQRNIAETLQRSFLPSSLPAVSGYDLAAQYRAALTEAEVGGDFYDVFTLADGRIALLVADVSGKGLTAATYIAMGKYMVRAYANEDPSPGLLLKQFNKALRAYLPTGLFLTAFYAVLDVEKNVLTYANAGHNQPMMYMKRRDYLTLLDLTGPGLGVADRAEFGERTVQLEPGDTMLIYTDGATDVKADGARLGTEGLERVFRAAVASTAETAAAHIFGAVLDYGKGRLEDDIVILVLKRQSERT